MTPLRGIRAGGALTVLLLAPQLAPAAWNNVFQVTCCKKRQTTAAFFAPAPVAVPVTACAPPCPTTAFVQRSFYQPVVSYQAVTNYEPVTSFRTSYFYEPVTSYSYTSFYDPCSCSCQQVATPVTSFRLRSQCNAVVNYVARVSYRPITTYTQSSYWEQVAMQPACPTPVVAAPPVMAAPPVVAAPAPAATAAPPLNLPATPEPALSEQRSMPQAGVGEQRDQYYMPPANGSSLRGAPRYPAPAPPPPVVQPRPERVASLPGAATTVAGRVVRNDFAPRPGAKVMFVSAQRQDVRQAATADAAGQFRVALPTGGWYVYVDDGSGRMTYHNQIDVRGQQNRQVTVVSR
jgi:hypothetical protein